MEKYAIITILLVVYGSLTLYEHFAIKPLKASFEKNYNKGYLKCFYKSFQKDLEFICDHHTLHYIFLILWICCGSIVFLKDTPFEHLYIISWPIILMGFWYTMYISVPYAYEPRLDESEKRKSMHLGRNAILSSTITVNLGLAVFFISMIFLSSFNAYGDNWAVSSYNVEALDAMLEGIESTEGFSWYPYVFLKGLFYTNKSFVCAFSMFIIAESIFFIIYKIKVHLDFCKLGISKYEKNTSVGITIPAIILCLLCAAACIGLLMCIVSLANCDLKSNLANESIARAIKKASPWCTVAISSVVIATLFSFEYSITEIHHFKNSLRILSKFENSSEDLEYKMIEYYTILSGQVFSNKKLSESLRSQDHIKNAINLAKEEKSVDTIDTIDMVTRAVLHEPANVNDIISIQENALFINMV